MGEWNNRRIARAFYERASENEKNEAYEFFQKLDSNGDGKVSLREFKKSVSVSGLSNEKVFKELDSNRDGALDFDDVLVLFYYKNNTITILRCRGRCGELIFGPSFSCFKCFLNSVRSRYAVCRDCHDGARFNHEHPLSSSSSLSASNDFTHDQALLVKFSLMMPEHPQSLTKKEMKRLWKTAKSENGGAASPQVEVMANNFLNSVDDDDNQLDIQRFSTLMMNEQESELEAFLKPRPESGFATNYMKDLLGKKLSAQYSSTEPTAAAATTSTLHANPTPTHHDHVNPETTSSSSNAIVPTLKVATTIFKVVEMALTIASLSSMCTIM